MWDATGAIILQTAPDEFIVGGTGIIINFSCTDAAYNAGILSIENGTFDNGKWQPNLRLKEMKTTRAGTCVFRWMNGILAGEIV